MNDRLKKLYQEVIIRHHQAPVRFFRQDDAPYHILANNPLCGDKFRLFFEIENGKIHNLSFHGIGCAISKAATSVLVESLGEMEVNKAMEDINLFLQLINPEAEPVKGVANSSYQAFEAAREFPGRETCAGLSWKALGEKLAEIQKK